MHVTYLLFIFALITRTQTKPALDFYGKSIEYDNRLPGPQPFFQPNEFNNELNLEKEFQVWGNGDETATNIDQNPTVEKKFFKICEQFELILHTELEQKKIDCSSLEFVPKTTHPVIKREVDEVIGSGDGEVEVPKDVVPDKEPTEENQSNNTNQDIKEPKDSKQEITDSKNQLAKQSESIKEAPAQEDPAAVQKSTENTAKASKDTNILICLFVAVGGVAVGAFAYNYLKKRRKNDAAHRVENVENVGNSTGKDDVEMKEEEEKMLDTKEETTENDESNNKTELHVEKKE